MIFTTPNMENMNTEELNKVPYAHLMRRVQATTIDALIVSFVFVGAGFILSKIPMAPGQLKLVAAAGLLLFYEPLLIAVWGKTLGQACRGIRVRRLVQDQRLSFIKAFVRYLLKVILGWVSYFFILSTANRQSLHDLATDSCVVLSDPESMPGHAWYADNFKNNIDGDYHPTKWRRLFIIVGYSFLSLLAIVFLKMVVSYSLCGSLEDCGSGSSNLVDIIGSGIWISATCYFTYYGWRGVLFGARKQSGSPSFR